MGDAHSRYPSDPRHPLLDAQSEAPLDLLLLEDNEVDALVFQGATRQYRQPISVRRARSLAEFKAQFDADVPDLICADHVLPDGLAMDALEVRNQSEVDIPFIVITGAGEEDVAVEYMKQGAADYLSKRRLAEFPLALDITLKAFRNQALRHAAEEETRRLNAELLDLIRHVEEERDEEKRGLSRDIHDQLGQELTALKLGMYMVQRGLQGEADIDTKGLDAKLEELIDLNTQVIQQVRDIARALRPVVLDQVGLSAGIETLVRDFNRKGRGFCGFHLDPLPELTEAMRTDLFRIVQEALTNIQRHASAELAYVRLYVDPGALRLEIGDNGQGMHLESTVSSAASLGLGMVGMRERVRNHDGRLRVDSMPGSGTTIEVTVPLPTNT